MKGGAVMYVNAVEKMSKEFVKHGFDKMFLPQNYKQSAKFLADRCNTPEELFGLMVTVYLRMPL